MLPAKGSCWISLQIGITASKVAVLSSINSINHTIDKCVLCDTKLITDGLGIHFMIYGIVNTIIDDLNLVIFFTK